MKPWETLATTRAPDGTELILYRHDRDFVIRAGGPGGYDLMTSRMHGSEEELARLALPSPGPGATVLVGGLGMGYTLRAALDLLPGNGKVVVAELLPAVLEWNQGPLADLAGRPLDDPRAAVELKDVVDVIRESVRRFDAILLDVDNGPSSYTQGPNRWLYSPAGLAAIKRALKPKGVLAVWSVETDRGFEESLRRAGYQQQTHRVRARGRAGGPRQVIFIGRT